MNKQFDGVRYLWQNRHFLDEREKNRRLATMPNLSLTPHGFVSGATEKIEEFTVAWSEVVEIRGFKRDFFTHDDVRFTFALNTNWGVEISEDQPGFDAVLEAATREFPALVGWRGKIIQPPFATNETVFYSKANPDGEAASGDGN